MAKDCPDCTEGKEQGPRCFEHEAIWHYYRINCHLARLREMMKELGRRKETKDDD